MLKGKVAPVTYEGLKKFVTGSFTKQSTQPRIKAFLLLRICNA